MVRSRGRWGGRMWRGRRTRGGALGVEARAAAPAVTVRVIAGPTYAKSFSACPLGTARARVRACGEPTNVLAGNVNDLPVPYQISLSLYFQSIAVLQHAACCTCKAVGAVCRHEVLLLSTWREMLPGFHGFSDAGSAWPEL